MKKRALLMTAWLVYALFALSGPAVGSEDSRTGTGRSKGAAVVEYQHLSPSRGQAPGGEVYDGPYPLPFPYYPYSYSPYPWPPSGYYPPPQMEPYGGQLIPAGRLVLLVDPVSAEVYVDGHRLGQRNDLTFEVALLVGRHKVEVRAAGFSAYEKWVEILGGHRILLTIRLEGTK